MATRTRKAPLASVPDEAPEAPATPKTEGKGIAWLQDHIEGVLGEEVSATKLRVILRNLVKAGEIEHESGHGWNFTGIKDPAVRAVLAKLKGQAKAEAAPAPKKAAPAKRTSRAKAKPVVEEDEDLFEDEDIDLD